MSRFGAVRCRVADVGDVATNPYSLPKSIAAIEEFYDGVLSHGCRPLSMGGDHTIVLPILRAMKRKYGPVGMRQCTLYSCFFWRAFISTLCFLKYTSVIHNHCNHACTFPWPLHQGIGRVSHIEGHEERVWTHWYASRMCVLVALISTSCFLGYTSAINNHCNRAWTYRSPVHQGATHSRCVATI